MGFCEKLKNYDKESEYYTMLSYVINFLVDYTSFYVKIRLESRY